MPPNISRHFCEECLLVFKARKGDISAPLPSFEGFLEGNMTDKDFVNMKIKDRFHKDYELTDSEIKFALFCTYFVILGGLFGLFYWMLQIATR